MTNELAHQFVSDASVLAKNFGHSEITCRYR